MGWVHSVWEGVSAGASVSSFTPGHTSCSSALGNAGCKGSSALFGMARTSVYFPKFLSQMSSRALSTAPSSFLFCLFPSLLPLPVLTSIKWKRCKKKVQLLSISADWEILAHLDGAKAWALTPCVGFPLAQEILSLTNWKVRIQLLRYLLPCRCPTAHNITPGPHCSQRRQTSTFRDNSSTLI